jgi:hypothetical protein
MIEAVMKKLSYANVMATLALFVALGGFGYAAAHLPRDSVGSKQIKEDAVKASEQAPNSVDSGNVIDLSLDGGDLADNAIGSSQIANDTVGSGDIANGSVARADIAPLDVGTPTIDECSPGTSWTVPSGLTPHYWKDKDGIAHLEGAVSCSVNITNATILEIPRVFGDVYDPAGGGGHVARFAALGAGQTIAQVAIVPSTFTTAVVYDGGSATTTEGYISLDGLTWRTD